MPRRNLYAPSFPGRASVEGPPQIERASQGAPRHRLWYSWTRRLGQLVCVIFYQIPCDVISSIHPLIFSPTKFSDDHFFDVLTARTCHGHPLPCNRATNNTCVSEDDAASVFAIGDFEYKLSVLPSGRLWILDLLIEAINNPM